MLSLPSEEVAVTTDEIKQQQQSLRRLDKLIKKIIYLTLAIFIAFGAYYWHSQYQLSKLSFESKAIKEAKEVIHKYPRSADARVRLGYLYAHEGKYDKALEQYDLALKLQKDHQEGIIYSGIIHMDRKNYAEAMRFFDKEIKYYKNTKFANTNTFLEQAFYYGGVVHWKNKKYDKAIGYLSEAAKISKTNSDTRMVIGRVYYDKKDYDKAITSFNEALRFDPRYVDALYGLALSQEKKGDKKEALKVYKSILKINPEYKLAKEALVRFGGK